LAQAALFGLLSAAAFSIWPLAMAREVRAAGLFRAVVAGGAGRPQWAYVVATGLAVAALAGLAIATAPERKIAIWFVIGAILCFILFRLAGQGVMALARRVHATGPRLRLALGNLHRPGAATPSVVMSLGLGLTVLVTVATIEGNVNRQIGERLPARAPSFFFLDIQPDQVAAFDKLTRETPGVQKVERAPALRGRIVRLNGVPVAQANVAPDVAWALDNERGLTYAAEKPANAKVVAGEWWPADYSGPPQISFDGRLAAGMGLALGDRLTVNVLGRDVEVKIANFREVDYQSLAINFAIVFAPGFLERAPHTHIATVYADQAVEAELLRAVTKAFPNVSGIRVKDALDSITGVLGGIGSAARATSLLTLLAGTLVLVGAIAAGQRRRRQDAVILKVLGATRADVIGALLLEYGALGALTAMVASVVGAIAGWAVVTQIMRAEWTFLPGTVAAVAALCAALTILLGLAGAWRALGQKSAPILREA
jgi:putative ABC transport system permease protein